MSRGVASSPIGRRWKLSSEENGRHHIVIITVEAHIFSRRLPAERASEGRGINLREGDTCAGTSRPNGVYISASSGQTVKGGAAGSLRTSPSSGTGAMLAGAGGENRISHALLIIPTGAHPSSNLSAFMTPTTIPSAVGRIGPMGTSYHVGYFSVSAFENLDPSTLQTPTRS